MAILVAAIVNNAKVQCDKLSDASVGDPDWVTIVNRKVQSLYRFIVALDREAYFAQGDFSLTATPTGATKDLSTVTYAPSGTFVALHGFELNPDAVNRRTVPRRAFRERNTRRIGWWTPAPFVNDRAYDLRGRTIVVSPFEAAAGSYRAYVRLGPYQFTALGDGTALDWQLEPYVEWVELMAARDALGIEESDTGYKSERLSELRDEIRAAHTRDDTEAAVIADVEEDGWGPW